MIVQYLNSPRIRQLVENIEQYFNIDADVEKFYSLVWNVDTAQGFGLDIWGRIVGVGRYIEIEVDVSYFGFEIGATPEDFTPFGVGTMFTGTQATSMHRLVDDAYRVLILTKALSNIVATTSEALNQVLKNLFPNRGRCYVNDHGNMKTRYTFEFLLRPWEYSVIKTIGILPHSSGVAVTMATIPIPDTFGFQEAGSSSTPFGYGSLLSEGAIINVN